MDNDREEKSGGAEMSETLKGTGSSGRPKTDERVLHIAFVIATLGGGGAERVATLMADYWSERGYRISIVTFEPSDASSFYPLPAAVQTYRLNANGKGNGAASRVFRNIQRIYRLRRQITALHPDAVLSFIDQTNIITLISLAFRRIPVIITEHVDPLRYSPGKVWEYLRIILYPFASVAVAVSKGIAAHFPAHISSRMKVIPNPIDRRLFPGLCMRPEACKIMAMGRLVPQKGFDLLIRAFALIHTRYPRWTLEIWGEGPSRDDLSGLIDSLGLQKKVLLPGTTPDPYRKMATADLFVLSSRFEGFGIVICEAMACGLPVISFDCPSGPSEILEHEKNGLLVPPEDSSALAEAIERLIADGSLRRRLAEQAAVDAVKYSLERVMPLWDDLLKHCTRHSSRF